MKVDLSKRGKRVNQNDSYGFTITKPQEIINLQKQKIIECYLKKGFINAEVIRVELNKIVGTDYYHVTYFITEGKGTKK